MPRHFRNQWRRAAHTHEPDTRDPGFYLITLCTFGRRPYFANPAFHEIAELALERIPTQPHAQQVRIDSASVKPDHVHVILEFLALPPDAETRSTGAAGSSLRIIVSCYKSAVTKRVNQLRRSQGAKLWQRGFYERHLLDPEMLAATRRFITENPQRSASKRDTLSLLLSRMWYHG